jgi:hypothetical protein
MHSKIGKKLLHAIVYAKETQVKYIYYSLALGGPFLELPSSSTMPFACQ